MLALTTYAEPRNLLIDLAFLGLSTITSDRPLPPSGADRTLAPVAFLAGEAAAFFVDEAGAFFGALAEGFAVLVSGDGSGALGDLADLRATVPSYPIPTSLVR